MVGRKYKFITEYFILFSQIIGIINSSEMKTNMMKFTLTNRGNDVIQCIMWNALIIEKIKQLIVPGNVS